MAQLNSLAQPLLRKRDVISRVCSAIFGGYAATVALGVLLARLLPLSKVGATVTAILSTALLYLCAILWAFAARSPLRAWVVLGFVALGAGTLSWGLIAWGGH